ncbi:hypothetical protein Cflav_PD2318 [Pedosphaera parvula Ellin514]|uniref:Uncharacterized protein n=1 Tax=Pedosphaera parvula (strain Ellin514) TaxID=320771 RepID=B9XKY0_PEDPL|nr:hypothetical protein Cflav_PD2318 [Pedosphaera parvula Ellin514]
MIVRWKLLFFVVRVSESKFFDKGNYFLFGSIFFNNGVRFDQEGDVSRGRLDLDFFFAFGQLDPPEAIVVCGMSLLQLLNKKAWKFILQSSYYPIYIPLHKLHSQPLADVQSQTQGFALGCIRLLFQGNRTFVHLVSDTAHLISSIRFMALM